MANVKEYVLAKYKDSNKLSFLIIQQVTNDQSIQINGGNRSKQLKELKKVVEEKKAIKDHIDQLKN